MNCAQDDNAITRYRLHPAPMPSANDLYMHPISYTVIMVLTDKRGLEAIESVKWEM